MFFIHAYQKPNVIWIVCRNKQREVLQSCFKVLTEKYRRTPYHSRLTGANTEVLSGGTSGNTVKLSLLLLGTVDWQL